jgi:hypothetical protein
MTTKPYVSRDVDMRVDEEIWGHRIYNEQTPWLCFLEFLGVLYSEYQDKRAFIEDEPNALEYVPQHRLYLRNILFNNPRLITLAKEAISDESRWQRWFQYMKADSAGLGNNPDFHFLKKRFGKFSDFVQVVNFLRGTAIEGDSNKRWSSKFVFPYGPACFYEDGSVSPNGALTNDRRFFARTGEILYLMLCRSGKGQELLPHFKQMLFDNNNKWNRLVKALQPGNGQEPPQIKKRDGAYLPIGMRKEYQELASDWLHILNCSMPGYDALPHMVNIMSLHMIRYLLNRAHEEIKHLTSTTFVMEIISSEKNSVHQLATASFQENNRLTQQAVMAYIETKISSDEWQTTIQHNDIENVYALFERDFQWKRDDSKENAEQVVKDFKESVLSRHQKHLDKVHSTWATAMGFASRRNSRSTRYTPKDILLKTLVLCTVSGRMEFQEFLERLYSNYGIIIGSQQAISHFNAKRAEQDDFKMNERRLEDRLASLGLLKRLSDAYAYIENPFSQELR